MNTLDPTKEFPVDGAAGEGFTNVGSAQAMSPALITKYLDAAKAVAAHGVLLPDGIGFSRQTTRRDHTDEIVARIQKFYRQFTADGDGKTLNSGDIEFTTNQGGLLPLEKYLSITVTHRNALQAGRTTIEEVARQQSLNAKYLKLLWNTLANKTDNRPSFLIALLREKWQQAAPEDVAKLVTEIESVQKALWKFNTIGIMQREGGPKSWMEAITPIVSQQEFRLPCKDVQVEGGEYVEFCLAAGNAGDGNDGDFVCWKNPRLERAGQPPLLLRDANGIIEKFSQQRLDLLARTTRYLAAVEDINRGMNISQAASTHEVAVSFLKVWLDYLMNKSGEPVSVRGYLTKS